MFVIDSSVADRSYDEVCAEIESTITKHGGRVVDLRKWDERRLAYEINRARRGTYLLVHFEVPPEAMSELRRDFVLSENILRQILLVDTDGVPTGEERPGITTTISEASYRRRPSGPRPSRDETSGDEAKAKDGDGDEKADAPAEDVSVDDDETSAGEEKDGDGDEKADAPAEDVSVDDDETSEEAESSDDGDQDDTGKDT